MTGTETGVLPNRDSSTTERARSRGGRTRLGLVPCTMFSTAFLAGRNAFFVALRNALSSDGSKSDRSNPCSGAISCRPLRTDLRNPIPPPQPMKLSPKTAIFNSAPQPIYCHTQPLCHLVLALSQLAHLMVTYDICDLGYLVDGKPRAAREIDATLSNAVRNGVPLICITVHGHSMNGVEHRASFDANSRQCST